jgi:hypothetical protein
MYNKCIINDKILYQYKEVEKFSVQINYELSVKVIIR